MKKKKRPGRPRKYPPGPWATLQIHVSRAEYDLARDLAGTGCSVSACLKALLMPIVRERLAEIEASK
jgi:hypothetical protein